MVMEITTTQYNNKYRDNITIDAVNIGIALYRMYRVELNDRGAIYRLWRYSYSVSHNAVTIAENTQHGYYDTTIAEPRDRAIDLLWLLLLYPATARMREFTLTETADRLFDLCMIEKFGRK